MLIPVMQPPYAWEKPVNAQEKQFMLEAGRTVMVCCSKEPVQDQWQDHTIKIIVGCVVRYTTHMQAPTIAS